MTKLFSSKILHVITVVTIFYVGLYLYWENNEIYLITGDEPHFLMIAESLIKDGDLVLTNNYAQETLISQAMGGKPISHTAYGYSIHGIGLGLFLLIPYLIKGVSGAKLFLSVFNGIALPFLFYSISKKITGKKYLPEVIALVLACGLPFLAASNQIYPDLVAGVIVLFCIWILFVRLAPMIFHSKRSFY